MSGKSIDKKVQAAFKKIGIKTGFTFDQYRPNDLLIPMRDANWISKTMVGFSQDEEYSKAPDDVLQYFKIYMKYDNVLVNDILYSTDAPATLVVLSVQPMRGAVGVKCTHFIDIFRPVHTPTLDVKVSTEEIGRSVPCAVEFVAGGNEPGAMTNMPTRITSGTSNVKVWLGVGAGVVKINDLLSIDGYNFRVKSVSTANGTKVVAESVKAGV